MKRQLAWALLLLLGSCDDMSSQPKQRAYSPGVGPVTPPGDTVEFEARPPAPPALTETLLARGQERYRIYCAPCHAENGAGDGMIVQRGFPAPESFHTDRLRQATTQHFYDVISNGQGAMYSFAARIPPQDRWTIAAYVRALQRSQHATAEQLTAAQRPSPP